MSAQFRRGEGENGAENGEYPKADDDLRVRDAHFFAVVMKPDRQQGRREERSARPEGQGFE